MTVISKWGNSLGVRLPKPVAEAAGLTAGLQVGVRLLDNGCILVTPRKGKVAVTEGLLQRKEGSPEKKW